MSAQHFLLGDTREVIATIPDGSVDLVVTSPPFLALRSYLPADHPDKGLEIGSEATPAEFIDVLLGLAAEWRRVLAPHGSIAIELGDTYSGSGGAGGDYAEGGWREGQDRFDGSARRTRPAKASPDAPGRERLMGDGHAIVSGGPGWPLAKSLTLIPELFRIGLVYGINPLTGAPSPAGRWRARNVVRWVRPNPPVGALGDKFRPATSEIVVACVSDKRWFDGDAVRVPSSMPVGERFARGPKTGGAAEDTRDTLGPASSSGSRPLYDWWEISPGGYGGAHYAVWPPELVVPLIESMCPREVCTLCGQPRRRIVERTPVGESKRGQSEQDRNGNGRVDGAAGHELVAVATVGWTVCACPAPIYRPGIVLDPFGGSGTTLAVASGHGRTGIGIDLDERNLDLARERVGMFLTTDHPFAASPAA